MAKDKEIQSLISIKKKIKNDAVSKGIKQLLLEVWTTTTTTMEVSDVRISGEEGLKQFCGKKVETKEISGKMWHSCYFYDNG